MPDYNNLPGTYINRLDGGLRVSLTDEAPVILLLGIAEKGVGDEPFLARDTAKARDMFGGSSSLYRGLTEARRAYGEGANIFLYRIGTEPAILTISGSNAEKIKIVPRDRVSTIGQEWKASFNGATNTLWVWDENDSLVFSNSTQNQVDIGEVEIRGDITALSGAQSFGDPTYGTLAGSVPFASGTLASGTAFSAANTGPAKSNIKGVYEALQTAYRRLDSFNCDIVVPMDVYIDSPNVAYFISGTGGQEYPKEPWQSRDNPIVWGSGTLGWFKETAPTKTSTNGQWTYEWADDIHVSGAGASVTTAPNWWATPTERIADDYHEVNFAYQLANFCYQHTKNQSSCIGVIGFRAPDSYYMGDIHLWAGEPPELRPDGSISEDGFGMAGFPELVGATASRLNPLCHDKSSGRSKGLYATDSEFKDAAAKIDEGGFPIDIGAYISVCGDSPVHVNAVAGTAGYTATFAPYYAGLIASLDEKRAPTNVKCPGLNLPYDTGKRRRDNLIESRVVMLAPRRDGVYIQDAPSAAMEESDFRRLSTVRLVSLVERRIRAIGRKYIGQVSNRLLREGLRSDIEEGLQKLRERGYLNDYRYDLEATPIDLILGKMKIKLVLVVPLELRRIETTVSLSIE